MCSWSGVRCPHDLNPAVVELGKRDPVALAQVREYFRGDVAQLAERLLCNSPGSWAVPGAVFLGRS
jgi:hypothetical protein